jgi:hypothetical protein
VACNAPDILGNGHVNGYLKFSLRTFLFFVN